jgi:lipid II:glycine glycyltransferase (peptidoglycan interpeptide bridge formation enzyme)
MLAVKEITEEKTWREFIESVKPHTFLHSWQWGEFNAQTNHPIIHYGIFKEDKLCAVALILHTKARRGQFLFCPHGPVIANELDAPEVIKALTETLKAKAKELGCAFIRISPLLLVNPKNEDIFLLNGYKNAPIHMAHPEIAWILDVTPSEEELLKNMRKSTRYSIKKAEKDGVVITKSTDAGDIEKFWRVYETTFSRQHFTPFSKDYLKKEFEIFAKDNGAMFFFAEYKGEITATALIIFDKVNFVAEATSKKGSGYYHHGATTQKFPGLTDAQLLQWEVIKEIKSRGLSMYNFWGVVPEDAKDHPWAGLSTFKRGFGGAEERYVHAKDLPISRKYWLTYCVEFIRRKKRHL